MKQPDLHGAKRFIRPITYGILFGAGVCAVLLMAMSAIMGLGSVPQSLSALFATMAFVIGGFVAGYISAVFAHEKGMLLGVSCGICLFLILTVASFAVYDTGFTAEGITKLVSVLLASAIGGILGVNKKNHFK